MDTFVRIKRLVLSQRVIFTAKAEIEMYADGLTQAMVFEAIINAPAITKTIRARRAQFRRRELLYVIKGLTYDGVGVYTKGKIARFHGQEVFYVFVSSKRSTDA